jgi:hypothetical protein
VLWLILEDLGRSLRWGRTHPLIPGTYTSYIAETIDQSLWESLHVEPGFQPEARAMTGLATAPQ